VAGAVGGDGAFGTGALIWTHVHPGVASVTHGPPRRSREVATGCGRRPRLARGMREHAYPLPTTKRDGLLERPSGARRTSVL
jgi:hypothetical protein